MRRALEHINIFVAVTLPALTLASFCVCFRHRHRTPHFVSRRGAAARSALALKPYVRGGFARRRPHARCSKISSRSTNPATRGATDPVAFALCLGNHRTLPSHG